MAEILIAEDEDMTRDLVRRALETDGHEIAVAADGREALELANARGFDLVVTDVDMPNMDGVALAEALIERNPRQRVILMSAIADELSRARAMMRGNVRIITKPVTLEKIRGEVTELLG
jgi:two-component system cell cycle response regulator CpdR